MKSIFRITDGQIKFNRLVDNSFVWVVNSAKKFYGYEGYTGAKIFIT